MKKNLLGIVVLTTILSLCFSSAVFAAGEPVTVEEVVTIDRNGLKMVATFTYPKDVEKAPVVVMFHGFTGQRNEMDIVGGIETMYGRTARIFAEQGYASLRIDFIGSGESDGKWENTTVSGQISDALAAIEYVKTLDRVDADRIALLGLSQGGTVAACTAGRSEDVDAVILWSAVSLPQFVYSNLLGQDNVLKALKSDNSEELIVGTLPWGATTTLKANFYQDFFLLSPSAEIASYKGPDFFLLSPSAEIASYKGPLQVTVGLMDTIVYPQPYAGQILLQYHEGYEELVIMDDVDHMLNILTGNYTALDRAISNALDFLKSNI